MNGWQKNVLQHLHAFFPQQHISCHQWAYGRIGTEMPDFCVFCVHPSYTDGDWVYVSAGIGQFFSYEFVLISPKQSEQHIETLSMLAVYARDFPHLCALGCAINIGWAWLDDSPLHHLLICLPYPYGPNLEYSPHTRFLWLMPISETEQRCLRKYGLEYLENLFDEQAVQYRDPYRQSVV